MTIEELREILHRLHLDGDARPQLIYLFYQTDDGLVNNLTISLRSARQRNRRPMTQQQLAGLMEQYPDASGGKLLAVEHPAEGLTRWIDATDVCQRLHTSRQTLRRWVARGLLLGRPRTAAPLHHGPAPVLRPRRGRSPPALQHPAGQRTCRSHWSVTA